MLGKTNPFKTKDVVFTAPPVPKELPDKPKTMSDEERINNDNNERVSTHKEVIIKNNDTQI